PPFLQELYRLTYIPGPKALPNLPGGIAAVEDSLLLLEYMGLVDEGSANKDMTSLLGEARMAEDEQEMAVAEEAEEGAREGAAAAALGMEAEGKEGKDEEGGGGSREKRALEEGVGGEGEGAKKARNGNSSISSSSSSSSSSSISVSSVSSSSIRGGYSRNSSTKRKNSRNVFQQHQQQHQHFEPLLTFSRLAFFSPSFRFYSSEHDSHLFVLLASPHNPFLH
ncbi:hypothetical protein VYU27_009161, partial [Nannochloropsis oceanica]